MRGIQRVVDYILKRGENEV